MDQDGSPILPMFPLPEFFLFPGAVRELYIFEARYRQMVDDQLDLAGRLVLAAISGRGRGDPYAPPVFPVAGLGEIVRHEPLPDGEYLIWVLGLGRVRVEEVPSDRLYRRVRTELLPDVPCGLAAGRVLRPRLLAALQARGMEVDGALKRLPVGALADLLLQGLELTVEQLEEAFGETRARERAELALSRSGG